MQTEEFKTIINGSPYKFVVWGSGDMWSANAYVYDTYGLPITFADGNGSDDVILKLVKLIEELKQKIE